MKLCLWCSSAGFELNSWGCISNPLEFNYAVKLSLWCSSDGSELNSWRCIFNPLDFHLRCEGVMALLCSRVRAELVEMYLQFTRMSFTLWRFHGHALQPGSSWTHGDVFSIHHNFIYIVKLSSSCFAAGSELNSWGCVSNPLEFHLRCEGFSDHALQPNPHWTHGDVFRIP